MKKRRRITKSLCGLALTSVTALALLAGCSQSSSDADTAKEQTDPKAKEDDSQNAEEQTPKTDAAEDTAKETAKNTEETKHLTLWMPPYATDGEGALDKDFWATSLEPWAKDHNVDLSVEIIPWGNYEEKHLTGFSSGEGPDVTYMYSEMIGNFIDMGTIEALDTHFTQEELDQYVYKDKGMIRGKQYMIPFIVGDARVLCFNMDIMEKAGITEFPKTWNDFIDTALKIKDANLPGVIPFAQPWAEPAIGALNSIYYPFLWQAGGEIYNEAETEVALLENDAAVRAAQFLYDLKYKYEVIPEESMSLVGTELVNQFIEGNIAMAYIDARSTNQLTSGGVNWDFIPSLEDKTSATWIATDGLVVNSASKNKELAIELVKHITGTEIMTKFHTEIAPYPPITKDEEYLDTERFKEMYADTEHLHSLPKATNAFKVMDTLYKNLQLMMLDELSPEDAIKNTVDYSSSIS